LAKFQLLAYSRLSNGEILRKAIHISGFAVPLLCLQLSNTHFVSTALFLVTIVYIASEVARTKGTNFPVFSRVTRKLVVPNREVNRFVTAPIFFAMGIIFSLLVFPPHVAYTAVVVLTFGDGFASVFGRIFGKTSLLFNRKKNLEGTICGFTCAFLGALLFVSPLQALVAAAVGMFAESLPLPVDDNLVTPLSAGTVLILFALF
jgi:phytol kinase